MDTERTFNILELCCFPKGCLIPEEDQPYLATVLVPKLEGADMKTAEWTRGALMLEEPYLEKVKNIVCRGCGHTMCPHNSKFSPIADDDPLRAAFRIPYGERMDFDREVLDQLLPEEEVDELKGCGLEVFKWMSSSRNQIHITVKIGEQSVRYSAHLRHQRSDLSVNNEDRPVPTSIADIRTAVKEIADGVIS